MKDMERLSTLFSLKEKGRNLNEQLNTVQHTHIVTNEHGVKWDKELEKFLSTYLVEQYRMLFDETYAYIYYKEYTYLQIPYLIYGKNQDVFLDFNSMKLKNQELKGYFILVVYKSEKEGFHYTHVASNEYQLKVFIVTDNPEKEEPNQNEENYHYTLLEALEKLDRECQKEEGYVMEDKCWKLSEYIENQLMEKGITKKELAEQTGIIYKTLISKFKINSITGEELLRISIVLDLDLNELKSIYRKEEQEKHIQPNKHVKYIASLVKIGFTSGIVPSWELEIPQKQLYPLTIEEQHLVAEQIEAGYNSGYLKGSFPRSWKLHIEEKPLLEKIGHDTEDNSN